MSFLNKQMINKLKKYFNEMVVYKDLKTSNFFSALSLPSFMRDWLLKKFANENGNIDFGKLNAFVRTYLPDKEDWTAIKDQLIKEYKQVRLLAKVSIDINIGTGKVSFALPDFGLSSKDTIVEDDVWEKCRNDLIGGSEAWGVVEIAYRSPEENYTEPLKSKSKSTTAGKIKMVAFKAFCPYVIDVGYYKDARQRFSIEEWIDVLLGAVDYNASGYLGNEEKKLTMLTRLLPFVEKRLNLIELAPKGTGKSYLFGRVSRFGWLSSGGVMSRAKMFYDLNKRTEGLVRGNDFITLDEVQTISFSDVDEMRAALKGYLESGIFTVGNYQGIADAGVILCGNIRKETMESDGFANMFAELPEVFHESALIERFHGFIKGWNIPRMNDDLKIAGWALNSEYFCSIMHELREDTTYRAIVDKLVHVPEAADTRDTEAIKRIATAYLKLLFPHVCNPGDIDATDFSRYCLSRAIRMRGTIKYQLGILDAEYRGKDVPKLRIRPNLED